MVSEVQGRRGQGGQASKRRTNAAAPPPAVNEPLTFIMFVATYPVGSTVEGVVASYTSHGAMVDVELPEGGSLHCYVPLSGLGDPPRPRHARSWPAVSGARSSSSGSTLPPRGGALPGRHADGVVVS